MIRPSGLTRSLVAALCLASALCGQDDASPQRKKPAFPRAEIGLGVGLPHLVHLGASVSPWSPVFVDGEIAAGMLSDIGPQGQIVAGYQMMGEDDAVRRFGLGYATGSRGNSNGQAGRREGAIVSLSRIGLFDPMNGHWGYKAALSVGTAWDSYRRPCIVPLDGSFGLSARIL